MQNAGFILEYILLDLHHRRIPTSQLWFDAGGSLNFDFGVNFL